MDLTDDAKTSAINTVNAYASAILAQKDSAVSAANSLVSEVQAVFNNSKVTYTLPTLPEERETFLYTARRERLCHRNAIG